MRRKEDGYLAGEVAYNKPELENLIHVWSEDEIWELEAYEITIGKQIYPAKGKEK